MVIWGGKRTPVCRDSVNRPLRLIRSRDSERFHFAVEVAAFEAEGGGRLSHIPAVLFELAKDELALIRTAGFVERRVGMVRAFGNTAKEFGR
jgi:hypothetical protein